MRLNSQVDENGCTEGTDSGNDKGRSEPWDSSPPNHALCSNTFRSVLYVYFLCGFKRIFTRSVAFLPAVTYVLVMLMFSFACVLFFSLSSLKSRTRII